MALEGQGGDTGTMRSPGGFEFGIQGWMYGEPRPTSITFYLDNTASIADQYGRLIRRSVVDGVEIRFADAPPSGQGGITPRPQFATHAQVIAALTAERFNWLSYEVRYRARDGIAKQKGSLSLTEANTLRTRLINEGNDLVQVQRSIACAGWPQLPYAELKKLPELPPTPIEEIRKVRDPQLRQDALRVRREADEVIAKETAVYADE